MKYSYKQSGLGASLRQLALAAGLVAGVGTAAQAQALNYPLANTQNVAGTYTDLGSAGTVISTANNDDANSAEQLIGFNFAYNGASMDRFILNTNGFLKLGAAAGMTAPTVNLYTAYAEFNSGGTLLGTATDDVNLLSPFNYDLTDGTSPAEYRMATTGTAPNRVCTIQWKNVADKPQPATAGGATILTQYANMAFQVKLYEANSAIEFVFASVTPAPVANNAYKYSQMGIKGSGNATNQIVRVFKGSVSAWGDVANVTFANGPVTAGATGAFNFRQAVTPDNGRTFRFVPSQPNDVAVSAIQGYASVVVPASNPITIRGVVKNLGSNAQSASIPVTLTISGANTYTQTQNVSALAVGAAGLVTFSGITLANVGQNTVTISLPNDDNNSNNSYSQPMETSATTISLATPGGVSGNSVFTAGPDGYYASKITFNTSRTIASVRALISDAGNQATAKTSVGEVVYGVVIDATTGALLARSPNYIITQADVNAFHTFALSTPATVPAGDVLIGMAQAPTSGSQPFFPFGVQDEDPFRANTYFSGSASSAAAPAAFNLSTAFKFPFGAVTSTPGTCPAPTALNITSSTSTTASFSFPAATGAIGYQIVYGPTGFTPGGTSATTPTFTSTTYTVTGLAPSTGYDFYIRTVCSATDQSGLTGPVQVTTACTPPTISTFPYTQNFDQVAAGQTLPCGITVLDSNNDGFTWQDRATVDPSLATGNISRSNPKAIVYSYNNVGPTPTIGADDWFFTPALTLANTQRYRVSFYYRTAGQGLTERLEVKYGPAATPAGQTTTIYTNNSIGNTIYLNATNTSTVAVADIVATGTNFVGFHAISTANQGFLAIDDLTITSGPLATSEALKHAVSVFPNPSNTGQFNLEIHGANSPQLAVEVTNMLGQRVYSGTAKDNLRNTLDLSGLTSGIYTLKVRNGQEFTQQQISIVK